MKKPNIQRPPKKTITKTIHHYSWSRTLKSEMSFLWKSDTAPNVLLLSGTKTALSEDRDKEKKKLGENLLIIRLW